MSVCEGILTTTGGMTSHAAVVARGMGKPCVSGCDAIHIDDVNRRASIGDTILHEGDVVTIDGTKLLLADGRWILVRKSGTEPVRAKGSLVFISKP